MYLRLICLKMLLIPSVEKQISEMKFHNAVLRCASDQNNVVDFDYLTLI
jgi:hypothetical protein